MSSYIGDHYGQDYEDDLQNLCETCAGCQQIIRPEQTAVMLSPWVSALRHRVDIFYHKDCLDDADEYTGEELME